MVTCSGTQNHICIGNSRCSTMDSGLGIDTVLDTIEKAVVDDLLTFTREPQTELYFSDCELCDPATRGVVPDLSSRVGSSPMWGDSGESQEPSFESKYLLKELVETFPLETPRRTIAPVPNCIKMREESPELTSALVPYPVKRASELPASTIVPAKKSKLVRRSRRKTPTVDEKAQFVPKDAVKTKANVVAKVSKQTESHGKLTCNLCQRGFKSNGDLRRHVQGVHLNIRAFPCTLCSKRFKRQYHLTQHLFRHSRESPPQKATIERPKNTPVIEEKDATPVIQETKAAPVIQEAKAAPVIQEAKTTPVVEQSETTSVGAKSKPTESRQGCKLCVVRSRKLDCQRNHLYTEREDNRLICVSCKQVVWTQSSDKAEDFCERPHRCPCGTCYDIPKSYRKHFRRCWRRQENLGSRCSSRLNRSQRTDQDTQSEPGSEASP